MRIRTWVAVTDTERAEFAGSLVADASVQPVSFFDRNVKALVDKIRELHRPNSDVELDRQRQASKPKRWTERDTGMRNTLISLDPVRDARGRAGSVVRRCCPSRSRAPTGSG